MKIDKGIPIPVHKWDFLDEMEVGDSVAFSTASDSQACATVANKKFGRGKFVRRVMPDGSYRIWRVA